MTQTWEIVGALICSGGVVGATAFGQQNGVSEWKTAAIYRCNEMAQGSETKKCIERIEQERDKHKQNDTQTNRFSTYKSTGFVKSVDIRRGTAMLDLGPVQAMGWPVMMVVGFVVRDEGLLGNMTEGKHVKIEFRKEGADLVIIRAE